MQPQAELISTHEHPMALACATYQASGLLRAPMRVRSLRYVKNHSDEY